MERPKEFLPGVAPVSVPRPTSVVSHGRLRWRSRFGRWLTNHLDRLDDRMRRRREELTLRWDRLNREDLRERLSIRVRRRWYLLIGRIERRAALVTIRWYRFLFRALARWERLALFSVLPHRRGPSLAGPEARVAGPRRAWSRHIPLSRGGALVAGGLSLALAVTVIALLPFERDAPVRTDARLTDRPSSLEPSVAPTSEPEEFVSPAPAEGVLTFTDEQVGYLFSYPTDWDVSTSGTETVLSDPEAQVVISFDSAPSGSLRRASEGVVDQVTDAYVDATIIATEVDRTPQGYPSIAVGGTARDASGAIRFLVITIRGPHENRTLSVRFPAETAQRHVDAILEVVGSFRIALAS